MIDLKELDVIKDFYNRQVSPHWHKSNPIMSGMARQMIQTLDVLLREKVEKNQASD